jgi:hypothetical protein
VLQRQVKRPGLNRIDRVLLAAASTRLPIGTPAPNDVSTGDVRISFQRDRRPELRRVMGSVADGNAHRDILAWKLTARLGSRRLKTSEMRPDWTRMQAT